MLVDDEEFCLSSMKVILQSLGIDTKHRVDCCITGKEALDQVSFAMKNRVSYSIILTDISMPIMNGIEATIKIR
jgi:CheY-like chemotaxis protein